MKFNNITFPGKRLLRTIGFMIHIFFQEITRSLIHHSKYLHGLFFLRDSHLVILCALWWRKRIATKMLLNYFPIFEHFCSRSDENTKENEVVLEWIFAFIVRWNRIMYHTCNFILILETYRINVLMNNVSVRIRIISCLTWWMWSGCRERQCWLNQCPFT